MVLTSLRKSEWLREKDNQVVEFTTRSNRAELYSFASFRIILSTTKMGADQSSHTTRYARVNRPCHICGRSEEVTVPSAPFAWESPCLELIFSTRVPVRNATVDINPLAMLKAGAALIFGL